MKSKTREITPDLAWKITCHEAGHAIVAARCGVLFDYAERDEGEHGQVQLTHGLFEDPEKEWCLDEIAPLQLYYAGGDAAEEVLFGSHREGAALKDKLLHAELEKLREQLGYTRREDGWGQDVESAKQHLDREKVEKLARALDRQPVQADGMKRLTYEEVYGLLGLKLPWDR
jgi:hypothetical protein